MNTKSVQSHGPRTARHRGRSKFDANYWGWSLALIPFIAIFCVLVAKTWFLCDDAFISFRYVRNLVDGLGLVFNAGEAVEGYTNFLWVVELAGIWAIFGIRPEAASLGLSLICTVSVFVLVMLQSKKSHRHEGNGLLVWMALGLLLTSTTFAAWTTSGLETRQFTLCVVAAIFSYASYADWKRGLWVGSACAGAAALTRPEGLMLGCICVAYYIVDAFWQRRLTVRGVVEAAGPFGVLVGGHFLFRYAYYGQWLPNTYYAKHVRPWFDSGFDYILTAGIETGAYLWLPLAVIGAWARWRELRDSGHFLALAFVIPHIIYLLRIGGDHFEFRPMDFYWPLLALPAVEGLLEVVTKCFGALRTRVRAPKISESLTVYVVYLAMVVYAGAIQASVMFHARAFKSRAVAIRLNVPVTDDNSKHLRKLPAMAALNDIANASRARNVSHMVGTRIQEHRIFGKGLQHMWGPFAKAPRPMLPKDAVAAMVSVGVEPFYLPDLQVIDIVGLTDATIAHSPVEVPNEARQMAHDRRPPPGYFHRRGVNFNPYPSAENWQAALHVGDYAVEINPGAWLPFDAVDRTWVETNFKGRKLVRHHEIDATGMPVRVRAGGRHFRPRMTLGHFETGLDDGWSVSPGMHVESASAPVLIQQPVFGRFGSGFLSSFDRESGDFAVGSAMLNAINVEPDDFLFFMIAGGAGPNIGVRLMVDGATVMRWTGQNTELFRPVVYPLSQFVGKKVSLQVFDQERGPWGHIMLDQVMLVRSDPESSAAPK